MKRKSLSSQKIIIPPTRKSKKFGGQRDNRKINISQYNDLNLSLNSDRIIDLLDLIKENEKSSFSKGKLLGSTTTNENITETESGYLLDLNTLRALNKISRQKINKVYEDKAVSPIKNNFPMSLSPFFQSGDKVSFLEELDSKKKENQEQKENLNEIFILEKNKLLNENQILKEELENFKNLYNLKLNEMNEYIESNKPIKEKNEFLTKKNEILMDYLKEKEIKILSFQSDLSELKDNLSNAELCRTLLHNQIQELKGNLRIFCRIKPNNSSEISILNFPEQKLAKDLSIIELKSQANNTKSQSFFFDKVFYNVDQKDIFTEIQPFIQSCIDGEQVCILAYGQTGSGKTFTLEGPNLYEEKIDYEKTGILPRSVEFIFKEKERLKKYGSYFKFVLSVIEIYNDNLIDLLNPENKINITQINNKVIFRNLQQFEIEDFNQLLSLVKKAARSRITDKTHFNERSSRSHCIYRINIGYSEDKEGILNIVDLAGSERSSAQFLEELQNEKDKEKAKKIQNEANFINKSLTTLGRIIRLLSEKQPISTIPYRESKLTRILQDCLGGSAKTLMFINICNNSESYNQTKESLKFSSKIVL